MQYLQVGNRLLCPGMGQVKGQGCFLAGLRARCPRGSRVSRYGPVGRATSRVSSPPQHPLRPCNKRQSIPLQSTTADHQPVLSTVEGAGVGGETVFIIATV